MTRKQTRGFTIVELMVTLAVAAVLMGMAVPAFNDFVSQRRMASRSNDFLLAITYARSEAIRRNTVVSVQAVDDTDPGNEWGPGYCVVPGDPGNCGGTPLRSFAAIDDATLNGVGGMDGLETLSFNTRGMLVGGAAGAVQLCSLDSTVDPGRQVAITAVGRPDGGELQCNP